MCYLIIAKPKNTLNQKTKLQIIKRNKMKKLLLSTLMVGAALLGLNAEASAQNYRLAGGVFADHGYVGASVKGFLSGKNALHGLVGFSGKSVNLGLEYHYQNPIPGANGLDWYVGVGGHGHLHSGDAGSDFAAVPMIGLEYTIPGVPLNFAFDWRPHLYLTGPGFSAGHVGGGVRFVFNK